MGGDQEGREVRMEAEEVVVSRRTTAWVEDPVEEEEEGMGVERVSVAQTRLVEDHGSEERAD